MFGLLAILMVVGSGWCQSSIHPYVESRQAFTHARVVLQNLVPHDLRNLSSHEARVHLSGGVLVAVILALGKSVENGQEYDPIGVLDERIPAVWENYNLEAADPINQKLAELHAKIKPVAAIIDALCPGLDIDTCDSLVQDKVETNTFLRHRANILLAVGKVSQVVNENEKLLKHVTSKYNDIPHLFDHVNTESHKQLVYDIADIHSKLHSNQQ